MNNRNKLVVCSLKWIDNYELILRENELYQKSHLGLKRSSRPLSHE